MKKTHKTLLSLFIIVVALLIAGRWVAFWLIKKTLVAQVEKLQSSGVTLSYKSLDVNAWSGSLRIGGIVAEWPAQDSVCHSTAVIPQIRVHGIHLFPLLISRKLVIDSVVALNPQITYIKSPTQPKAVPSQGFLKDLEVRVIRIDSGALTMLNTGCQPKLSALLDVTLHQATVEGLGGDSILWRVSGAEATSLAITLPTEFYEFRVKQVIYSMTEQSIHVDSISMVPTLGRLAFAQQSGHQVDQIHCTIPRIDMGGVMVGTSYPPALVIHQMDLGFVLQIYRDKRFPSIPRKPTVLPVTFMHQLPFSLRIDSLNIASSSVTYEEFPQTGEIPGKIGFNDIRGCISNITTDSVGESILQVTSRFMKAGDLEARFTFPMTPGKANTIQATLTDFHLPAINGMLLPLANLEVQTGMLQSLRLQFQYDEIQSNGELDLRYTGLNVQSIRKNEKRTTNRVISALINTLVQNNMDRSDRKSKRSGAINWKRDPQSGLPNYWWKSILSGLRSVYSLDKVLIP